MSSRPHRGNKIALCGPPISPHDRRPQAGLVLLTWHKTTTCMQVARVTVALAALGCRPPPSFGSELALAAVARAHDCAADDVCRLLWSLARMRAFPRAAATAALLDTLSPVASRAQPRELACAVWALPRLTHASPQYLARARPRALRELAAASRAQLAACGPLQLAQLGDGMRQPCFRPALGSGVCVCCR